MFVQSFFYKLALRIYSEIYLISSIGYIYICRGKISNGKEIVYKMFEEDQGFLLEIHRRNPYKWNFLNIKDSLRSSSFFLKRKVNLWENHPVTSRAKSYYIFILSFLFDSHNSSIEAGITVNSFSIHFRNHSSIINSSSRNIPSHTFYPPISSFHPIRKLLTRTFHQSFKNLISFLNQFHLSILFSNSFASQIIRSI